MTSFKIQRAAGQRLGEIFTYNLEAWRQAQVEKYLRGMFERFDEIAARAFPWSPIPAEFGVDGYVCKYGRHFIYSKLLDDGTVGNVTILHERMHQIDRFRDDRAKG